MTEKTESHSNGAASGSFPKLPASRRASKAPCPINGIVKGPLGDLVPLSELLGVPQLPSKLASSLVQSEQRKQLCLKAVIPYLI